MRKIALRLVAAAGIVGAAVTFWPLASNVIAGAKSPLDKVEADVRVKFDDVTHVAPEDFRKKFAGRDDVVVVDVRERSEYAVSRIPGAIRVNPGISGEALAAKLGDLEGKTVVLYCSVGVRSSQLAEKADEVLATRGVKGVYNLSGGIFRWHNEKRPLRDAVGQTDAVHPYNIWWSRYLSRADGIRYSPREAQQ